MNEVICSGGERRAPSLFDRATKVFDGWTDPETGARVLRIHTRGQDARGSIWSTQYHQFQCFRDGGREVLLHRSVPSDKGEATSYFLLDLTTGETRHPFPSGLVVNSISDEASLACLEDMGAGAHRAILWDMHEGRELVSSQCDGWELNCIDLLSDGRRAMVFHCRGKRYTEPVQSRHYLLCPHEPPRLVLDVDGYFCSHIQGCPTAPELYAYDRWPSPNRYVDQVLHLRTLDGQVDVGAFRISRVPGSERTLVTHKRNRDGLEAPLPDARDDRVNERLGVQNPREDHVLEARCQIAVQNERDVALGQPPRLVVHPERVDTPDFVAVQPGAVVESAMQHSCRRRLTDARSAADQHQLRQGSCTHRTKSPLRLSSFSMRERSSSYPGRFMSA